MFNQPDNEKNYKCSVCGYENRRPYDLCNGCHEETIWENIQNSPYRSDWEKIVKFFTKQLQPTAPTKSIIAQVRERYPNNHSDAQITVWIESVCKEISKIQTTEKLIETIIVGVLCIIAKANGEVNLANTYCDFYNKLLK